MKIRPCIQCGTKYTGHNSGVCIACRAFNKFVAWSKSVDPIGVFTDGQITELMLETPNDGLNCRCVILFSHPEPSWIDELPIALDVHVGVTDPYIEEFDPYEPILLDDDYESYTEE